MNVAIIGDLHGDLPFARRVLDAAYIEGVKNLYQVGDFGFLWNPNRTASLTKLNQILIDNDQKLYWVDGNHENFTMLYSYSIDSSGFRPITSNIVHIPRGKRFWINGRLWMGLGGATSLDRGNRTPGVDWWPEEELRLSDLYRASDGGRVDVLLTHDCPSRVEIPGLGKYSFPQHEIERAENHRSMLGSIVDDITPQLLIHGHFHFRYDWHRINRGGNSVTKIVGLDCNHGSLADSTIIMDTETAEFRPLGLPVTPSNKSLTQS